ncbi:MAG: hypothetical protein ACLFR0_02695 [Alphaproteobacteria bacterium]
MFSSHRPFYALLPLLCLIILGACTSKEPPPVTKAPLTPLPPPVIDPSDFVLKESLLDILKETGGPLNSGYISRRADLNNDGRRDALVLFKTPYGFWCGTHGCTMLVMQAHNDVFTLHSAIQTVRPPVYISDYESNGWKNIIMRVSGRSTKAKNVSLQFDGESYPSYPDVIPRISADEFLSAKEIMN